jgi:hypothetical protein
MAACAITFLAVCSSSFDIMLYNSADKSYQTKCINLWQEVSNVKSISIFGSIVILAILTLASRKDQFVYYYFWSFVWVILSGVSGLVQVILSGNLKTVHNDCIMKCSLGAHVNVNNRSIVPCTNQSADIQETSFIIGVEFQDSPPAYETIEPTDKCPSYEEVIIQIQNLPELEKITDYPIIVNGS